MPNVFDVSGLIRRFVGIAAAIAVGRRAYFALQAFFWYGRGSAYAAIVSAAKWVGVAGAAGIIAAVLVGIGIWYLRKKFNMGQSRFVSW